MKKSETPKPPTSLSRKARVWWGRITSEWTFGDAELLVLQTAMESFDRMAQAQELIAADGPVIEDRFGQKKQHPATFVERDSRASMLAALKQLKLDIEPNNTPVYPARRR
jgi:P27 family predicted phage terminase small subunit